MRNHLFLTTAIVALALSACAALAQTQNDDQQMRKPGAEQAPEPGAPRRPGGGDVRPNAAKTPEAGAPRRGEGGEGQPQRPATGAAQSQPAAGAAGQRPAEGAGSQRSGEAPPEPRRPTAGRAGEGEAGKPAAEKAGEAGHPAETGAARTGEAPRTQAGRPEPGKADAGRADAGRADAGRAGDRPRIEGRLNVDERDAAGLRERLIGTRRDAVTNVRIDARIDARVGARIATDVTIREVPTAIVAQYPMFRGYDYVVSEEQVVIVDPKTREVVEVIGGGGRRAAADATPKAGLRQRITTEQRQIVRKHLQVEPSSRVVFDERVVHEVPNTIVLKPLPEAVIEGVPDIRGYDYFVDEDDHVVLVDPATREVVEILD